MKWITVSLITALSLATGCRSGDPTKLNLESPTVPDINPLLAGGVDNEVRKPNVILVDASATGRGLGLEGMDTTQQVLLGVGAFTGLGIMAAIGGKKGMEYRQKKLNAQYEANFDAKDMTPLDMRRPTGEQSVEFGDAFKQANLDVDARTWRAQMKAFGKRLKSMRKSLFKRTPAEVNYQATAKATAAESLDDGPISTSTNLGASTEVTRINYKEAEGLRTLRDHVDSVKKGNPFLVTVDRGDARAIRRIIGQLEGGEKVRVSRHYFTDADGNFSVKGENVTLLVSPRGPSFGQRMGDTFRNMRTGVAEGFQRARRGAQSGFEGVKNRLNRQPTAKTTEGTE